MRLSGQDPDIQTLVTRIREGEINLQPDFQRGEVWGTQKKRRLIDTILRNWHIPPIHLVVVEETGEQEVLDGQQRLVSIRDFVNEIITVDGKTYPPDEKIERLDGLTYSELPEKNRKEFNNFTIRVFRLTDYEPGEPGELFYRLNQPTNLTGAEQRNAFYGPARNQVKLIVKSFEDYRLDRVFLGFSNSRMAYDDLVAKVCYTIEAGSLREKITSNLITQRYRSENGFCSTTIMRVKETLSLLGSLRDYIIPTVKFNKATLFSWLCFFSTRLKNESDSEISRELGSFLRDFEMMREWAKGKPEVYSPLEVEFDEDRFRGVENVFPLFNNRSSASVNDVSSVVTRDFIIWLMYYHYYSNNLSHDICISADRKTMLEKMLRRILESSDKIIIDDVVSEMLKASDWGRKI